MERPAESGGKTGFLPSIALMRGVAALLVVYDHLVGMWLPQNGVSWRPAQLADRWIFEPLHQMMHGGGFAVALFFMVSGFVIFHVAQRETRREFVIRRLLRIYPPLWASFVLLAILYWVSNALTDDPGLLRYSEQPALETSDWPTNIVAAMTLGNYLLDKPSINGVAWTLIIEMFFYAIVALLLPLFRSHPRIGMCVAFAGLLTLKLLSKTNSVVFLLAITGTYVAFLFLGSLVYLRWAGRIGNGFLLVATVAFWGLFIRGAATGVVQPPLTLSEYGVAYAFAWLAFVVLLSQDGRIRLGRFSEFFGRISYSLYLNHGKIGLFALTLFYPWLGYAGALGSTFALVLVISAASYRWVELPSQRLARRLTARKPPQNGTGTVVSSAARAGDATAGRS